MSATPAKQIEKTCEYCEKILHGRIDQRFCNDTCRNNFNRRKRAREKIKPHYNTAEIIGIIKRNYGILKESMPRHMEEDEVIHCETESFLSSGVNLKFYTSTFIQGTQQWYCVFDRCYSIHGDTTMIQDFPEQAEI